MLVQLHRFTLLLLSYSVSLISFAQSTQSKTHYGIEAGTYLATAPTNPFWIRSNQYGEVPLESQGFTVRAQVKRDYAPRSNEDKKRNRFSYGYGIRAVFNSGHTNQLLLSEAYGKIRFGAVEFYGGRRKEVVGLVDSTLSAGSYIWSGNALPVPKVEISIPNYTPILKNGLISLKGNYSHGWLGSSDSVRNFYLHQKSLYFRLGKPNWAFKFYGGVNHQVQWGGELLYPRVDNGVRITRFGSDWNSYGYVVSAQSLYTLDTLKVENSGATAEGGGRVGNHLGSVDVAFEYETANTKWFIYRQSILESEALLYLNNISDGLNGLSITRKNVNSGILKIVIEYLHTTSQGGPYSGRRSTIAQLKGGEDYFNDGRYIDGWVYKGQTIGTPFIMPLRYTTGLPQNLDPNPNRIVNNRVNALTIGVMSRAKRVDLLTRLSFSNNLGSYYNEASINVTQTSFQQQIAFPINKYTVTAVVAYDQGGVLQSNLGTNLLIKRYF